MNECLSSLGLAAVQIRMLLARQPLVCSLDLLHRGSALHAKNLVIIQHTLRPQYGLIRSEKYISTETQRCPKLKFFIHRLHRCDLRNLWIKRGYCFTSKRLADDQLPGVPEDELARTRHHILTVGSVLVVNCETVVF